MNDVKTAIIDEQGGERTVSLQSQKPAIAVFRHLPS
jgi:hypothetical protein